MIPSFGVILLTLLASTCRALPPVPTDTSTDTPEIPACDPFYAFHRPSNQCEPLLQQSACREGEWFVLNRITKEPECQNRTCDEFELPLSTEPDLCVSAGFPDEYCGQDQILVADEFGLGHCECNSKNGFVYWPQDGTCHRVFLRGPCDPGHIFVLDNRNGSAVCKWNPCPEDQIYWLSRSECVSEDDPTLCPPSTIVTLDRLPDHQFTLACKHPMLFSVIGSFSLRGCERGSIRASKGDCVDSISFGSSCPPGQEEGLFGGCQDVR